MSEPFDYPTHKSAKETADQLERNDPDLRGKLIVTPGTSIRNPPVFHIGRTGIGEHWGLEPPKNHVYVDIYGVDGRWDGAWLVMC